MSKIDVKVGDKVRKGAPLGHSGSTGLAAGDHLHFAINLQGEFVNPLEWCDAHWMKDQVVGVWAHAGAAAPAVKAATAPKGASKPHKGKKKPGKHIKAKLKRKR
jgi:murein DD-endopeptidase MepM/ murein hydrolase activator NlpD